MDPGFKSQNVLTASLWIPESRYLSDDSVRQFTNRLLSVVQTIPGVISAGATTSLPLGGNRDDGVILAEGYQMKPGESVVDPLQISITPGYFEAIGTPIVRGRFFDDRDNETGLPTIIVDERVARKFWPGGDPIGKRMYIPDTANDFGPNQHTKC
jgi:hypothetical protein